MDRYEVHGVKVYQLNICDAFGDHLLNSSGHRLNSWRSPVSRFKRTTAMRLKVLDDLDLVDFSDVYLAICN